MEDQQLRELIRKYLDGQCTEEEASVMENWYLKQPDNFKRPDTALVERNEALMRNFLAQRVAPQRKARLWPRIAVAASIAIAVVTGSYFFYQSRTDKDQTELAVANDIAPGKNGATLTLANGKKIYINDALTGNIASQSGVKISKTADGQIIYEVINDNSGEIAYNTLSTTRGEQTKLRLPDGSLVFLNAASSLRYPTSFAKAARREVALMGEGYFEIAKDKAHPFIVASRGQEVEVLGTHFNVNSYEDEEAVKTTLLEGSVKVVTPKSTEIIKPNQQAIFYDGVVKVQTANTEEAVAWKNGLFKFENTSMKAVMRQMARWYDVEVVYEGNVPDALFTGEVYRSQNASHLLELLKFYDLKYRIDKKRIIISP